MKVYHWVSDSKDGVGYGSMYEHPARGSEAVLKISDISQVSDEQIIDSVYEKFISIDGGYACDIFPEKVAAAIRNFFTELNSKPSCRLSQGPGGEFWVSHGVFIQGSFATELEATDWALRNGYRVVSE